MDQDTAMDREEKMRILRDRAVKLAREEHAVSLSEEIEVCEFMLDREKYGIESRYIREVYPLKRFTQVPCTPSHVVGVINVRGQILSIIDIGRFFDLQRKGLSDLNKVIILHSPGMEFGILADEIIGVTRRPVDQLESSLPTLNDIRADYLKGVTRDRLIILDAAKILTDEKLIVNEEVK